VRLWLVGSLSWAITVGWLMWPGHAPQDYARYWYYRLAHREVLEERRSNEVAAMKELDTAVTEIRARYDVTRAQHMPPPVVPGQSRLVGPDDPGINAFELDLTLERALGGPHYHYGRAVVTKEGSKEVEGVLKTEYGPGGSPQLTEFNRLEAELDGNEREIEWWAAYMLAPPMILLIVGASLLWALRGFGQPRR
jgi:hypothetical protein